MIRPMTGILKTDAFATNLGQRPENARNCPTANGSAFEIWFATKITPPVRGTFFCCRQSRLVSGRMIAFAALMTVEIVCPPGS
jgi:hypothetical protein